MGGESAGVTSRLHTTLHPLARLARLPQVLPDAWPSLPQDLAPNGNSDGAGSFANQFPTAAHKYWYTERPCCTHVAITVQIRSLQRCPLAPRVPWVMWRSITTNRIACSARLFVGSTPGVVTKVK